MYLKYPCPEDELIMSYMLTLYAIRQQFTYIVSPRYFIHPRVWLYITLKIYIGSLTYAIGLVLLVRAKLEHYDWNICGIAVKNVITLTGLFDS